MSPCRIFCSKYKKNTMKGNELDCKPGYVESDHLSRIYVTIKLKQPTWNAAGNCIIPQVPLGNHIWSCFGWGLQSLLCYHSSGELLPRLSTLTIRIWRYISVALAWGSPPPDVIRHPALWSPDFPHLHKCSRDHLSNSYNLIAEHPEKVKT